MIFSKKQQDASTPEQITAFILSEMKKTSDQRTMRAKLESRFMLPAETAQMVIDQTVPIALQQAEREKFETHHFPMAIAGGLLAALIGGGVWAAVTYFTEYEAGYIAIGVGLLAGYAVVWMTGGRKGFILQIIAILSGLLAIAIGKYFAVYFIVKKVVAEQYGASIADSISFLSPDFWEGFKEVFWEILSPYDVLWVVLAVYSAWKIPQAFKVQSSPTVTSKKELL